jgi:hypothetical protein
LFYRCPISTLNGDELDEYPNLESYGHVHSHLVRIPRNFFKSTPKIKISFSGNYIKHVVANLFDHLKVLEELYFHDNACIDREGFAKNSSKAWKGRTGKMVQNGLKTRGVCKRRDHFR